PRRLQRATRGNERAMVLERLAHQLEARRLVVDDEHVHTAERRRRSGRAFPHGLQVVQAECQRARGFIPSAVEVHARDAADQLLTGRRVELLTGARRQRAPSRSSRPKPSITSRRSTARSARQRHAWMLLTTGLPSSCSRRSSTPIVGSPVPLSSTASAFGTSTPRASSYARSSVSS